MLPIFADEIGRNCDFGNIIPQRFSLPSTFIYYITKNPESPSLYQKLNLSCKYFYSKNPIILADRIQFSENKVRIYKAKERLSYSTLKFLSYAILKVFPKTSCKFWITEKAGIYEMNSLVSKILHENIFQVPVLNFKSVSADLHQLLSPDTAQSLREVNFNKTIFKYADGTLMPVEKIFKFFPNLEVFVLYVS